MAFWETRKTKEKKSHFKNLAHIASVDGDIDPNEINFLFQTGIRLGLTKKEVDEILKN